jgi:hypothetical protein
MTGTPVRLAGGRHADIVDNPAKLVPLRHLGIKRQHDQGQIAIFGQQLVLNDLVRGNTGNQFLIRVPMRQLIGDKGRRRLPSYGRLPRGE